MKRSGGGLNGIIIRNLPRLSQTHTTLCKGADDSDSQRQSGRICKFYMLDLGRIRNSCTYVALFVGM